MFLRHFADPKGGIPYGLALGLGGLIAIGIRRSSCGRSSSFPRTDLGRSSAKTPLGSRWNFYVYSTDRTHFHKR